MQKLALLIATTAYTGYLPGWVWSSLSGKDKRGKGGGLAGSLVALLVTFYWLWHGYSVWYPAIAGLTSFLVGLWACGPAAHSIKMNYGSKKRHDGTITDYDYNEINIDEVSGYFFASIPAFARIEMPFYCRLIILLLTFILFRFLDTVKPRWVKRIEEYNWTSKTLPVMADDLAIGIGVALIGCIGIFFASLIIL